MNYLIYGILLLFSCSTFAVSIDLRTIAEKSKWIQTGRADEAEKLCHDFQKSFPNIVQCKSYGTTPEGRSLRYLVIGKTTKPVVWVQAGIHAGEIDGKDAVFWLLKDLLNSKKSKIFEDLSLVFIPIVNLDGHERFGKWNRPNQVGPAEMGWRTTAQNLNLNRDFLKADAPEMRSLLKLWHSVDPVLSLDLHVTNGAQFQPEVGLIIHPHASFGSSSLHSLGKKFELSLLEKLKTRGHLALPFYPSFEVDDDPYSGFARYVSTTRFAHGYWLNNNRLGMLVETHSWKDYATRVKTHYSTVLSSLEVARVYAKAWKKAEHDLDLKNLSGTSVDLEYKHSDKKQMIDFPGYKFTKEKSPISDSIVIKYDPKVPMNWKVPFYEELLPSLTVTAPKEGYFIHLADADWLLPKLDTHLVKYKKVSVNQSDSFEVFQTLKNELSKDSFEGHQTLTIEGNWETTDVELPKNFYFVPINQPKGRLVLQMFEPKARDSFLAWGFFNKAFERKEYMENYVTDEVAREMLKDKVVKKEFEAKLEHDQDFAKSPEKRFDFFYRKHSSWDQRYNRYPVFRR